VRIRAVLILALGVSLGGCDASSVVLPDLTAECRKQPTRAVLHLDADDSRQLWATRSDDGADIVVRPRSDTGWRLDPGPPMRLVDSSGEVVGRDGDILLSVCFDVIMGTYQIGPDDLAPPASADHPPSSRW
jgi:hypothetical protein